MLRTDRFGARLHFSRIGAPARFPKQGGIVLQARSHHSKSVDQLGPDFFGLPNGVVARLQGRGQLGLD